MAEATTRTPWRLKVHNIEACNCSACQHSYGRWRSVEDRNCADTLFGVPVNIREFGTQQTIGLHSDLV